MKKILYIGGFAMPNKNAAAQRVLSIAKSLRDAGFLIEFYGVTRDGDCYGVVDNFLYEAIPYPKNTVAWIKYAKGDNIIGYIKSKSPDIVITYNYPVLAQEKVIRYCHKHGIKVVGDITEWYMPTNLLKKADTFFRMTFSNKHLDGIIAISRYLYNYYSGQHIIQLPPFVDIQENKWKQKLHILYLDKIKLIYAGRPSLTKDRLDYIVKGIAKIPNSNFILNVVGITKEQYVSIYGEDSFIDSVNILFHGVLPHNDTIRILMESDFHIFFRPNIKVNNAGFPTKFVESMTAGIPVIMNKISNVDDYLIDGKNGFMSQSSNEDDIRMVLERVSKLSRKEISSIKENIDRTYFDYHRYTESLSKFMNTL